MEEVLQEIREERARQDAKWGGPEHDDTHSFEEWVRIIMRHASNANPPGPVDLVRFRKQMIRVGAVAVAAVESLDRRVDFKRATRPDRPGQCGIHEAL